MPIPPPNNSDDRYRCGTATRRLVLPMVDCVYGAGGYTKWATRMRDPDWVPENFADNFDDGTALTGQWTALYGTWSKTGGQLVGQTFNANNGPTPPSFLAYTAASYTNVRISATIREAAQSSGLVVRSRFWLHASVNAVTIYEAAGINPLLQAKATAILGTRGPIRAGDRLELEANGTNITGRLNGQTVVSLACANTTPGSAGPGIGFLSVSSSIKPKWDDVQITDMDEDQVEAFVKYSALGWEASVPEPFMPYAQNGLCVSTPASGGIHVTRSRRPEIILGKQRDGACNVAGNIAAPATAAKPSSGGDSECPDFVSAVGTVIDNGDCSGGNPAGCGSFAVWHTGGCG